MHIFINVTWLYVNRVLPSIEVRDLVAGYKNEIVFNGVSFKLEGKGLILVLGPNASGKTTLLKTILGLLQPVKGKVLVNGVDITGKPEVAGRYIGYVPQILITYSNFPITVSEVVESAVVLRLPPPRIITPSKLRQMIDKTIKMLGLWEVRDKPLRSLSGGQRQKAFIARALVWNPSILLMDEPLSSVDPQGKEDIVKLMVDMKQDRMVVVTTHDIAMFREYLDKVLLVNRGIVAYGSPEEVLTIDLLRKVYGGSVVKVGDEIYVADKHIL